MEYDSTKIESLYTLCFKVQIKLILSLIVYGIKIANFILLRKLIEF
jgi:hypothetical protein